MIEFISDPTVLSVSGVIVLAVWRRYGDAIIGHFPVIGDVVNDLSERHLLANVPDLKKVIDGIEGDAVGRTVGQAAKAVRREAIKTMGKAALKGAPGPIGMVFGQTAAIGAAIRARRKRLGKKIIFGRS